MSTEKKIYRVNFHNQGKVYEVYARQVHQSGLFGFIEIEQIVFGEKSSLLVDPSEESLKTEFEGVERTYIPMHAIIRIDEVEKAGHSKISESNIKEGNVAPFPVFTPGTESGNN
tara:strand:+ start:613 stop:954 length:342 start_codon:yes stop_codon:yes gene_type:complete